MKKKRNVASQNTASTTIDNIIESIKIIKKENRASLSDESLNLLDECLTELEILKDNFPESDFSPEDVIDLISTAIKWLAIYSIS